MKVTVRIPTPLQKLTGDKGEVEVMGETVQEVIDNLEKQFPGVKERLCDEQGQLRRFVNIYLNNEDVRFLQQEKTQIKEGDKLSIIPAIAGGKA